MQRILVVEDDLDIQELLKNFLQEVGYAVTLASDGIEAISLFASTHFDLILLDIMLPKIDGFTVCELIRKQSSVPIIMLTALNGEEEQIRGLDLQVDDYITKPFSMPILVRKIGAVLRRSSMIPEQEHQTITYCFQSDFEKCGTVKFDRPVFLTTHKKHIRHNGIPNSSATIYSETERSVSEYEKTKNLNSFTHNGALCIGCFKWLCCKRGKPVNYQLNTF